MTYDTILRARSVYGSLQEVQQGLAVYQHMRKAGYALEISFIYYHAYQEKAIEMLNLN